MNIGLIGFGGVGKDFIKLLKYKDLNYKIIFILKSNGGIFNKNGLDIDEIISMEDSLNNHKDWQEKNSLEELYSNIDLLIELTPTNKENGEPALSYIKTALNNGISVVTGNKGPILHGYRELTRIAKSKNCFLGVGCTTGGALPTISGGLFDCRGAEIISIEGILNGTSNYILKEMEDNDLSYSEALEKARNQGISERDQALDVEGYDTAIKMLILANVLMGSSLKLEDVSIKGIKNIKKKDIQLAKEKGKRIKLIGRIYKENSNIKITVMPEAVNKNHPLYNVEGKNKGITYYTDTLGEITISGGASGTRNAAAAILRDILNYSRG